MVVLGWLGRYEAAEDLIPALPTTTPLDRYRRAYAEVFRGWRTTSTLDARPVVERLRDLEPSDRDRAESTIAFWRGVAEAGSGRELRDVPAPRGGRLSIRDEARLWLQRLWPLRWLLGMFLVTWVGLGVLTFVAAG
jgi:hypothetical protein